MTSFAVDEEGPARVVRVSGRLDLLSAGDMRDLLSQLCSAQAPTIVVDLGDVTVLDSSGLGALIAGLRASRQAGGDLRIARPNEQAQMVLELTRLDRVLRPHPTVEAALE